MLGLGISILIGAILILGVAIFYNKLPKGGKLGVNAVMFILSAVFAYLLYGAIANPLKWNVEKKAKYQAVVKNLNEIRKAQVVYKDFNGKYTKSWDSLFAFVDTAKFKLVERKEVKKEVFDSRFGISKTVTEQQVIVKGYKSVKDSLFANVNLKEMKKIPVEGVNKDFSIDAGFKEVGEILVPVFEVYANKSDILVGMDEDFVNTEVKSVSGVLGETIKIGDMTKSVDSGNWTKEFESN